MDKKQFTIKIENLVPTLVDIDAKIPCDNDGYSINFAFDEEWTNYRVKTGIFVCGGATHTSVFEGNVCKIPRIKDGTRCYIGVVTGEITEENAIPDKKTSRWCEVEAVPTITSIADEPSAPSPDVYTEFMALLNKYITEGGGGGLTKDEVKKIVATETANKVDKIEPPDYGVDYVYSTSYVLDADDINVEIQHNLIPVSTQSESGTIAQRISGGRLAVGTPENAADAVNKQYLEDNVVSVEQFKEVTAPISKIADHEKRIENLESTLLTFIEDAESAYEKDVPAGVAANAVISSIGKTEKGTNVLDPSLFVRLNQNVFSVNADGGLHIRNTADYWEYTVLLTLEAGTYIVAGDELLEASEGMIMCWFGDGDYTVTLTETTTVRFRIVVYGPFECDAHVWINKGETALPFEPYATAPVFAIESYNSSLIDDAAIFKELGWVKQPNGYWLGSSVRKPIFENTEQISGSLTTSYTGKTLTADGINNAVLTMRIKYTDSTEEYKCYLSDKSLEYAFKTYTTDASKTVSKIDIAYGVTGTFEIKDFRIDWGSENGEKVIDSFEIPQGVRAAYGYGKDGFVLDFESKTVVYEDKTTDVSQYLTDYDKFKAIKVQGGGKVRFVSESKLPVPSNMTYVKAKE